MEEEGKGGVLGAREHPSFAGRAALLAHSTGKSKVDAAEVNSSPT